MLTAPQLFALARGVPRDEIFVVGDPCFYCGAPADGRFTTKEFVKPTFAGLSEVPCPGSTVVCRGCVEALQEKIAFTTHDGKERERQRVRGYSWVISTAGAIAGTKADLTFLRESCLSPPPAPWSIVLSDGGQKHFIYRASVNEGDGPRVVTLDGEPVIYRRDDLVRRLEMCKRLVAATGKPALKESPTVNFGMSVVSLFGDDVLSEWLRRREEPLSRLAAWLCPNKEDCRSELGID